MDYKTLTNEEFANLTEKELDAIASKLSPEEEEIFYEAYEEAIGEVVVATIKRHRQERRERGEQDK